MKELAHEIHASVGVRMHRLGVCEWEVKLWMASPGPANGAWRVVVTNVTGHTCTVHVSVYIIYGFLRKGFHPEMLFQCQVCKGWIAKAYWILVHIGINDYPHWSNSD